MISQERQESHARRWLWAIPLSALLHALIVPLALVVFAEKLLFAPQAHAQPELVVATTSVRFERRPVPRRQGVPAKPAGAIEPQPQPRPRPPVPATLPEPALTPTPPPTPKPSATPQPVPRRPSTPLEQQIAAQQASYERAIAAIRQHDQPLSVATVAPQTPASYHRSAFDVPGNRSRDVAQALLFPLKHWIAGDLSCYYTHYAAQFSNGATEDGVVPWPVCYPRDDDRIAKFPYPGVPLPIPYPQPGYALPAGTYLSPFLQRIYRRGDGTP